VVHSHFYSFNVGLSYAWNNIDTDLKESVGYFDLAEDRPRVNTVMNLVASVV
jgi:hypothetical protein